VRVSAAGLPFVALLTAALSVSCARLGGIHTEPSTAARVFSARLTLEGKPFDLHVATHDNFLPAADARRLFGADSETRRFFSVDARNHRFSGGESQFDRTLRHGPRVGRVVRPR
jgi:hypothetical protein